MTAPNEPLSGRVVFRLSPPSISPLAKAMLLAHMCNDPSMRDVPADDYFYRALIMADVPEIEAIVKQNPALPKLYAATDAIAAAYQMEIAAPRRVALTLECGGSVRGYTVFNPGSTLSSTSTIAIDLEGLDIRTARLFFNGRFSVHADMEISLSNLQVSMAEYNLNTFAEAVSKELYDRVTESRSTKKGFLFWGSTRKTVESWMNSSIDQSATGASHMSSRIFLRDVTSPRLLDAATSFIFKPFEEATGERLATMAEDHRAAAIKADATHQTELAEAHRRYAAYLDTLRNHTDSGDASEKALEALEKIFKLSGGSGDGGDDVTGGAVAGGAASGNPYVAAAMFLARGIVYKDDQNSDKLHVIATRKAVWSETDSKLFSGVVASQTASGYSVTQASFPEVIELNNAAAVRSLDGGFTQEFLRQFRREMAEKALRVTPRALPNPALGPDPAKQR